MTRVLPLLVMPEVDLDLHMVGANGLGGRRMVNNDEEDGLGPGPEEDGNEAVRDNL